MGKKREREESDESDDRDDQRRSVWEAVLRQLPALSDNQWTAHMCGK